MEHRVRRFYELHCNKWFHTMNVSLEIIRTQDTKQKYMLMKYGYVFFNLGSSERLQPDRVFVGRDVKLLKH